jgi:Xylanase inhibitor N-terminal
LCSYHVAYEERSRIHGTLTEDALTLEPSANTSTTITARLVFGCQTGESGAIYSQAADGIVGLAAAPLALPSQLHAQGVVEPEFTLCYGLDSGVHPGKQ